MNFEDWLKQGLVDSPGGSFDEGKLVETMAHAKTHEKKPSQRRWGNAVRTAGIAAAAVVVAGGVVGSVLWSGHHAEATNKTTPANSVNPANSPTNLPAGQNQNTNSTAPTAQSKPSNSLQMYDAGQLIADKAIAWPGLQTNPNQYNTALPVVQVPFTATVTTPQLTAPKTIATSLPPQLKDKFTAYFVQLNATTSFYLLAPSGMTGKAQLATDGSFAVYLHSPDASIEVDTSGGSPLMAAGMAAPFFSAARTALAKELPTGGTGPFTPATITHPNANTAYFSFATKTGQNVAGWQDYLPESNSQSTRMIYQSNQNDWTYAPYVLQAGVNLLNNVLAPQVTGNVLQNSLSSVNVAGQSVLIPNSDGTAVQLPKGIAWIWQPPTAMKGPQGSPWSKVPTRPYYIAFATPQAGQVSQNTVQLKQPIPSLRVVNGNNDVFYAYPHLGALASNQWLLYTVTWAAPGMNQPYGNDLHVYDIKTGKDTTITSFSDAGGMFFSMGTSGHYLAYDKSGIIDAKGDFGHSVWLVDLSTGRQNKLPTSDLVKSGSSSGESVRVTIGGTVLTIPLSQG